jgi:hypothetical protein
MLGTYIEYNNKKYPIKELTIEIWANIMKYKNILDEVDLYVKMIADMTGLSTDEIRQSDANSIIETGTLLYNYINQESKDIKYNLEHNGIQYELCDFSRMSFGQFIDIDTFMGKDEAYKIANLNELASYLYTEKNKKYGDADFKKKIEDFKTLKVRDVEAAVFFLWTLEKALHPLTQVYSKSKWNWVMVKTIIIFLNFGVTMSGFLNSRRTKFGKLIVLLLSPLFFVSTICHTFLTYIRNKIKR